MVLPTPADASIASRVARFSAIILRSGRLTTLAVVADGWTPLVIIAFFMTMAAIVLTRYPVGQDSDGLLQTIISLQKLTVFFWGQDRFANLLPALTLWIRDPATNLIAQLVLRVGSGLLAPLFFCVLPCVRQNGLICRATLLASALFLAFAPPRIVFEALIEAGPYGTSLTLAGIALLALRGAERPGRARVVSLACRGAGLALTCAAYAVNASLVLVAVPLVLGELVLFGSALAAEFALASLFAGGFTALLMAAASHPAQPTNVGFGATTLGLVYYGREMLGPPGYFVWQVGLVSFAILFGLRTWRRDHQSLIQLYHAGVLAFTFIVSFVGVALSDWVVLNYMHPRYLVPDYFLVAALGGVSLAQLGRLTVPRRIVRSGVLVVVVAGLLLVVSHRTKSPGAGDRDLIVATKQPLANAIAAVVAERSLDGIAGDYWDVWPAIFQCEQSAYDLGEQPGRVFGITYRGDTRRAAFVARLLQKGRLDIACIGADPGRCKALLQLTMTPPEVVTKFSDTAIALPDGRKLTVFSIERPSRGADRASE